MQDKDTNQELSADDLALVGDTDDAGDAGETTKAEDKAGEEAKSSDGAGEKAPAKEEQPKSDKAKGDDTDEESSKGKAKSIATGADAEEEDKAKEKAEDKAHTPPPYKLTDEMREAIAEHYSAGDKKLKEKELKRLARMDDMRQVWNSFRELESKFTSGGLVKIPGKDASEEEVEAWRKARGIPEKAEEYFDQLKLSDGIVIGEADKPVVDYFAEAAHKAGVAPAEFSPLIEAYYARQEELAAQQDEADDTFRREAEKELKDEFGPSYKRLTNSIGSLFVSTPGGTDPENENSVMTRLLGGRTADGKIIGNDPDMVRWMTSMAREVNPAATVTEDGDQSGQSIDQEIAQIEKDMKEDRRAYFKDEAKQARYRELLETRDKIRAKA